MKIRRTKGLTLVEMLIAIVLASLLAVFFFRTFRLSSLAWFNVSKLDVIQQMRIAERKLRAELELGTKILHPPVGTTNATRIVFTDAENALRIIYWTENEELKIRGLENDPEVLATKIKAFTVSHPLDGLISCEITADGSESKDPKQVEKAKLSLGVSAFASNGFTGE